MFLKLQGNQDVCGSYCCKQEMPRRHVGRRPEGNDNTGHDGVTNKPLEPGNFEIQIYIILILEFKINLTQTK